MIGKLDNYITLRYIVHTYLILYFVNSINDDSHQLEVKKERVEDGLFKRKSM